MPFEETAVADQPELQTEETEVPESGAEGQELAGAESEVPESEPSQVADEGEQDADWLPDEQLKVFPDEQYERYAEKRYPDLVALLKDGETPEPTRKAVRQILHDKINSDIEIRRRAQAEEVPEEEVEEEAVEQDQPAQTFNPEQQEKAVTDFIEAVTDHEVADKWMTDFRKAFENKDPRQANIAATKVLTRGIVNLFPSLIDAYLFAPSGRQGVLDRYIESRYEGLGDTVKQTQFSSSWNDLVGSDAKFQALPAYDPKPNSAWTQAIAKVADLVPGFENFSIPGATPLQNFQAKAKIAANLLSSGASANSVAVATRAVETGKRIAKEASRTKELGKLGAGQSKGAFTQKTDDPLKASLSAHREQNNPFAALGQVK